MLITFRTYFTFAVSPTTKSPPIRFTAEQIMRQKLLRLGRLSTNLRMGIVGMANVGKSSTFNLLSDLSVPAENFPFCTIDPNHAMVQLKDPRYNYLCDIFKPESMVATHLSVTDIAGLVKGASEGFGLGNEFLSHIQQVDGLYQLVRAFDNDKILHTEGTMDPVRDLEIISNELVAKDESFISKRVTEMSRKVKSFEQNKNVSQEARNMSILYAVLQKCQEILKNKQWVRFHDWGDIQCDELNKLQLLTAKPSIYLINLSKEDYEKTLQGKEVKYEKPIKDWILKNAPDSSTILFSAEFEEQNTNPLHSKLDQIINEGYKLLNMMRFFTVGTDEVRSWTIREGCKAPKAASAIHTDFEKGFLSADVLPFSSFQDLGKDALEKYPKRMKKEGKEYTVQDGDIIQFKCKIVK